MNSNGIATDFRGPKQMSCKVTRNFKSSVSKYMAERVAANTLRVTLVEPAPVELALLEVARRTYNRNW